MEQFLNKTGNLFLFASLNWNIASICMEHSYISIFLIVHILKSLFKIFFFNFFFFPFWFTSIGFSLALSANSHFFFLDDGFSFIIKLFSLFLLSFHQQFFHWPFRLSHFFFLDDPLKLNYVFSLLISIFSPLVFSLALLVNSHFFFWDDDFSFKMELFCIKSDHIFGKNIMFPWYGAVHVLSTLMHA